MVTCYVLATANNACVLYFFFQGVLNGCEIAVKKLYLTNRSIDDKSFTNEFRQLMKVQHENIIRLIGYCYEIRHKHTKDNGQLVFSQVIDRALCFEYMPEGSLAKHISGIDVGLPLIQLYYLSSEYHNIFLWADESCKHDWSTTFKIIKGTCEGLHYLHRGTGDGKHIYHLDLKPDNILLDKDMVPKIADFGLSRLFGESKTHITNTRMEGTLGFMAPEYIHECAISPKNDVFSLGVIIFYLLAGQKGYNDYCESRSSPGQQFIDRVQEYWKKRMRASVGYTWDKIDLLAVKICTEIAMSCVEKERRDRPSTNKIIDELHQLDAQMQMSKKDSESVTGLGKSDVRYIALDPSLELRFPFKPNMDMPCCLQLTNMTENSIAFNVKTNKRKYSPQPSKGIIPPCSKSYIIVTLRAQEEAPPNMQCLDTLIVQSTRVSEDFTSQEITQHFLEEAEVDEVILPIAYVAFEKSDLDVSK
ncbi:cysteine-rich receptor-like protein kinase 43 isoform X1 [Aegilops tauschii subsp. strangulata]|uniref:cysteine-rich receptor-like protein kinase 43 isoform X1 n=1 Tax=Aegilops tauschii subsp. strangulata TaxID=200361 RepID=UPI001E1CAF55|nr:G-type lectin S-receptor-like serine/threonine-protein kinase At1g67520 isoform X1 [Aegilops tauschii subsp. strangulata]